MNKYWSYGKFSRTRYNKISEIVLDEMSDINYPDWLHCFEMFFQGDVIWDQNWDHMIKKLLVEAHIVQW